MTVTLFGHKDTPETIKPVLKSTITSFITDYNADLFYVGNNGSFDKMTADILFRLSAQYPHIRFYIVLAYLNDAKTIFPDHTIYPEGLETVPKRLAIVKRNLWMIDKADTIITYVSNTATNSFSLMEYAQNHKKPIINLYQKPKRPYPFG